MKLLAVLVALVAVGTGCPRHKKPTPACAPTDAACAQTSDCCSNLCNGTNCLAACPAADGNAATPGPVGDSCIDASGCCSGRCSANQICVDPQCLPSGGSCSTTGADGSCCTGYCDGTQCTTPITLLCGDETQSCTKATASACCSKVCDSNNLCHKQGPCRLEGVSCDRDSDCCGLTCLGAGTPSGVCSSVCRQDGGTCADPSQCCSRICTGNVCKPPPPGPCTTLGEACASKSDCCSTNCVGASGTGAKDGICWPASFCNAFNDICTIPGECCSGLCDTTSGSPSRCGDAPGGCGQTGYPCSTDSNCCNKMCRDQGYGVLACEKDPGCSVNGDYCDATSACCNINSTISNQSQWVTCSTNNVCTNGGACNPTGDVCGYKASQDCCNGKKSVCKPDLNGVQRCFGRPLCCDTTPPSCTDPLVNQCCAGGYYGTNPNCCIPTGGECHMAEECCNLTPCVFNAQVGKFLCGGCKPRGSTCTAGDTSCCSGLSCVNEVEIGWVCDVPTSCTVAPGGSCSTTPGTTPCCAAGACVAGTCSSCTVTTLGGACDTTPGSTQCCTKGFCTAPPGTTAGTCELCAPDNNGCSSSADCCSANCNDLGVCVPKQCNPQGATCSADRDCCSTPTALYCKFPLGSTSGSCQPASCSATGQTCAVSTDCCNYNPKSPSVGDTCVGNVCVAGCHQATQGCTYGGNECCSGLTCNDYSGTNAVLCTAGATCSCGALVCPVGGGACAPGIGLDCCSTYAGYCGDTTTGLSCDPATTSLTTCTCMGAK